MRIGWVGLGRLGLPCALQLAAWGHTVTGYDVRRDLVDDLEGGDLPKGYVEPGVAELLREHGGPESAVRFFWASSSIEDTVRDADVVFVAVQTPHAPAYDGTQPAPAATRDFEYGYLVQAVRNVVTALGLRKPPIVIVSTVLPGTTNRLIRPLLTGQPLIYSPQFIAMGTVLRDFTSPEFILLGVDSLATSRLVEPVFDANPDDEGVPYVRMSIPSAELLKVAYNTFISMKIVWANHLGMLCDAVGADADAIVDGLGLATRRLTSTAYMRPGMGDGGACHPRDLIALADLENRYNLPPLFGGLAEFRDEQTRRLAQLAIRWHEQTGLGIALMGAAYKANVELTDGSPALLLLHYLRQQLGANAKIEMAAKPFPFIPSGVSVAPDYPKVFVVTTNFPQMHEARWPRGSVVIDPWGDVKVPADAGVTLVRPGRRQ